MPGLVDLHAHLPQWPNAGLGAGLDLLTWLRRYIFPLEREFHADAAARLSPVFYRALGGSGHDDRAALRRRLRGQRRCRVCRGRGARHPRRAGQGHDGSLPLRRVTRRQRAVLDESLAQSQRLIERWHGRDDGRLQYAVTPRFAVSCSAEMLRESADLARATGAYWQTHLAEDRNEIDEVAPVVSRRSRLHGRLRPCRCARPTIDRGPCRAPERARGGTTVRDRYTHRALPVVEPVPVERRDAAGALSRDAGIVVGLGSDVSAGPDVSIFGEMRAASYTQSGRRTMLGDTEQPFKPFDWLRLGSLDGARALGLDGAIGSIEEGKEADFICVDASVTTPVAGDERDEPEEICRSAHLPVAPAA